MNLAQFFEHWRMTDNPFRGEEARHDSVFARVAMNPVAGKHAAAHPDFDKVLGDLARPSTSVVFGEKGSGKTAIRMQIGDRVRRHNEQNPGARVLVLAYDELNAFLDEIHARVGRGRSDADPAASFKKIRLVDHIDAILALGVSRAVDGVLGSGASGGDLGPEPVKRARQMSAALKNDLVLLQAVYDRADVDGRRTARLRSRLRLGPPEGRLLWLALAAAGWIPAVLAAGLLVFATDVVTGAPAMAVQILGGTLLLAWLGVLAKVFLLDRVLLNRLGSKVARQQRFLARPADAIAGSLKWVPGPLRSATILPMTKSDEHRYAMLARLRGALQHFGIHGLLVVMDRVDEPTLVNGDPDRMRAIVWPLFNNKFLQQDGVGMKLLLPIELRHALFKESSAFFQEARLDKQNLVERLSWTGAMLYDLCSARLHACRPADADAISLVDLFEEDVSRQDVVDALDQMHQPRDAFKFLYRCLSEHCANVTGDEASWRVPKLVLEQVRRTESERVQQLYRGIRPA